MPFLGRNTSAGFAVETVWGTPVTITNWLRVTSIDLTRKIVNEVTENLGDMNATMEAARESFMTADESGGSFEFNFAYDDSSVLVMTRALGTVATTGAGPYVHTCTLGDPVGLTIEQVIGTSTNSETFEGCVITGWQWSLEAGGQAKMSVDVIAQQSAAITTSSAESLSSTTSYVLHNQTAQASFNSNNHDFTSITIAVDHKIERVQQCGSGQTQKPERSAAPDVKVTLVMNYADDNLYTEQLAETTGDFALVITGLVNNAMTWTLHNAKVMSVSKAISSRGIIEQTIELQGFSDSGGDGGLKCAITNDNALATAN